MISKQKACHLILKFSARNQPSGNTFTFNMGDPIKIKHIVERLLFNYNKVPDTSKIKVTKLRGGEKLAEDLVSDSEQHLSTNIQDVYFVEADKNRKTCIKINFKKLESISPNDPPDYIKSVLLSYL
ncbi:polysaccharide biosynthesis protein [Pseudotamlana carrageenivorans]|uniref:Polysaccharide biosynthesis protein CapD-like domain-containing protein n=1 Tax=Pseudotamlana carrageenivorans TaxID=2069432 RepID=A0A2I7SLK7_9FLAO|nr:polysaccharide biosynthesis protein [Tamlana carrageenivorans]AUS06799.1 hypothetical protein C1A40_15725 [Tamlana carrageenivorans]